MANAICLDPIAGDNPKILILGTYPGKESLENEEYYKSNRNSFWYIIQQIFNNGKEFGTYKEKCKVLEENGIALWDVAESCNRDGSLDKNIKDVKVNDIRSFLNEHPSITKIIFNGNKAEKLFSKYFSGITIECECECEKTKSSSNACSISKDDKVKIWREVLLNRE